MLWCPGCISIPGTYILYILYVITYYPTPIIYLVSHLFGLFLTVTISRPFLGFGDLMCLEDDLSIISYCVLLLRLNAFLMIRLGTWVLVRKTRGKMLFLSHHIRRINYQHDLWLDTALVCLKVKLIIVTDFTLSNTSQTTIISIGSHAVNIKVIGAGPSAMMFIIN